MRVLITSGGTVSKVDDVRTLGNFSSGTTGSLIAEQFLRQGDEVIFVTSKSGKRPFAKDLCVDPTRPIDAELERVRRVVMRYRSVSPALREHVFETFEQYEELVKKLLLENPDVVILAAAVSDYGAEYQKGKLPSNSEELTIKLHRYPKVISMVKQLAPKTFLVGFKLLQQKNPHDVVDEAYKHGVLNHSKLTVANCITDKMPSRTAYIITPEKGVRPVSAYDLAFWLSDVVHQRANVTFCKSSVSEDDTWREELSHELSEFRATLSKLWNLSLFVPYWPDANKHFGFLAQRVHKGGFLITARGSNKQSPTKEDVVYVQSVKDNVVHVLGGKASLNANAAARIFNERHDVNLILHSHVHIGTYRNSLSDYPPGTKEDAEEVFNTLGNDGSGANLAYHGCVVVGSGYEDLVRAIGNSQAYREYPGLYDVAYHRFQTSDTFLRLVRSQVPEGSTILDLAGGTGALSDSLAKEGYRVTLADKSKSMLKHASTRLGKEAVSFVHADMTSLRLQAKFGAIVVRQAINYLSTTKDLIDGFRKMREHLSDNGVLVFNAPNFSVGQSFSSREGMDYEHDGWLVRIREMNVLEGRILTHSQHAILYSEEWRTHHSLYDLNRFAMFTRDEFEEALREAGFNDCMFLGNFLAPWSQESKSLYVVARA